MSFRSARQAAFVCSHVFLDERPVLLVAHEENDWIFACGGSDHEQDAGVWKVIGVGHLTDRDASLHDVSDLPELWEAARASADAPWVRSPIDDGCKAE